MPAPEQHETPAPPDPVEKLKAIESNPFPDLRDNAHMYRTNKTHWTLPVISVNKTGRAGATKQQAKRNHTADTTKPEDGTTVGHFDISKDKGLITYPLNITTKALPSTHSPTFSPKLNSSNTAPKAIVTNNTDTFKIDVKHDLIN